MKISTTKSTGSLGVVTRSMSKKLKESSEQTHFLETHQNSHIESVMVTNATTLEDQIANLTKAIEGLSRHVQEQDSQLMKLMDKINHTDTSYMDKEDETNDGTESSLKKKQNEQTKDLHFSSDGSVSMDQLKDFIIGVLNSVHGGLMNDAPLDSEIEPVDGGLMNDAPLFVEDSEIEPKVGMKFKNENEVFEFYKRYVYHVGFSVRKRTSQKNNKGVVTFIAFTCSREGCRGSNTSTTLKPQPNSQIGCKVRLSACSDATGVWRNTGVYLEHNQLISPSKSRVFRCYRQLNAHVKRQLEVNDIAGIPLHKSYNSVVVEKGGYENITFIEKDCRNYIDKVRKLRLGEGDAAAFQAYFSKMQSLCPGFFFSLDLDDEGRLKNVFWADNRSRQAYKKFGNVVTFDTTYLTNKYGMPFAPFVGVNHHGQPTLLGCSILSNEDTKTFVWLLKIWLECMKFQTPQGIITDQDRAMQNAIEVVFPNKKHRWCLWHTLQKLSEKFGYHSQKASIFSSIHELVYESQSADEFEQGLFSMLDMYELKNNDWLIGLFWERIHWVPCFLRTLFWAGMSTTQWIEGRNAFFDGYVHSKTSLKQFMEQYEQALRIKVEKEFQADFKS
ncbi:protein FAR1-RELATED SEQUENCE 5-like [Henckelia pumila]|uniref:protein FAR1-RELATED SEQUENCE 5-like n=1 Tax=Henckelia pumila TaxID=405737 RepID=UPI003C6E5C7C